MNEVSPEIVKTIQATFHTRVVSLVGYGSYFFNRSHQDSDLDLCLLLDTRNNDDLTKLSTIINNQSSNTIDITVHYLDEIEKKGWENFHHGTHGIFFLNHLAAAMVLLGDDIFARKAMQVPTVKYRESIIAQIDQYIDRIQVEVIKSPQVSSDYYRKYFTRVMTDMMLLDSDISYREINKSSAVDIMNNHIMKSKIFSSSTTRSYKKIMTTTFDKTDISKTLGLVVTDFQKQIGTK